jgi:hypothetical protein
VLQESFWDEKARAATIRYFVIDAHTGQISLHAQSMQAYQDDEYLLQVTRHGFTCIQFFPSLGIEPSQESLMVIVAFKQ